MGWLFLKSFSFIQRALCKYMIVNALAKIRIEHLWNTSREHYHLSQFGGMMEELVNIQHTFAIFFILFIIYVLQSSKY
jgi:hypothetical protein